MSLRSLAEWAFPTVDNALHRVMPRGWSPRWICHTADTCYGAPCDSDSRLCRAIHGWLYGGRDCGENCG